MQRQQQREERLARRQDPEPVERIAERGQGERHALVDVGVPEHELAPAQSLEREAAQREEVQRQVAEVEARARRGAAQERQERDERHQRADRRLARALAHQPPQASCRTARAGTPATSVPGGTSAVTTLPAATNERAPMRMPGQERRVRADERALLDHDRGGLGGEVRLQRVVVVADVHVREHQHALGERHLALERDALGQVEQALVAEEALVRDLEAGEAAPVEVEEAHVVDDRAASDAGARAGAARGRAAAARAAAGRGHGRREEAEAQRPRPADLGERLQRPSRRSWPRKRTSCPK